MPAFHQRHPISREQNLLNFLFLLAIGAPCIIFGYYFTHHCQPSLASFNEKNADTVWWMDKLTMWENTCRFGAQHPLWMANIVMLINMDLFFWLANLLQDSTWLIDPYWTIIPLLLGHFYWSHPLANGNPVRAWAVMIVLYIWSARLTHSYFRREHFYFGAREDWRFAELKAKYPKTWWWSSFFLAYVSQHIFLFGITIPIYIATNDPKPGSFGIIDILCLNVTLSGITLAYFADTTLFYYMQENEAREDAGRPKRLLLAEGVWKYSRHPNYVGEQLVWWGLGLLSYHQGHPLLLIGPFLNSVCLWVATGMVEDRMLRNAGRREIYKQYQRTTSVWIPLPRWGSQQDRNGVDSHNE